MTDNQTTFDPETSGSDPEVDAALRTQEPIHSSGGYTFDVHLTEGSYPWHVMFYTMPGGAQVFDAWGGPIPVPAEDGSWGRHALRDLRGKGETPDVAVSAILAHVHRLRWSRAYSFTCPADLVDVHWCGVYRRSPHANPTGRETVPVQPPPSGWAAFIHRKGSP